MAGRVVVRIQRPDEETFEAYIGDVMVAYANHDEHGWAGMDAAENTVRNIADALKWEVDEW